jgi:hypothetical protein
MTTDPDNFDPEHAAKVYRETMLRIDAATDEPARDEYRRIAQPMHEQWAAWIGNRVPPVRKDCRPIGYSG